jgi:hypothetical protein
MASRTVLRTGRVRETWAGRSQPLRRFGRARSADYIRAVRRRLLRGQGHEELEAVAFDARLAQAPHGRLDVRDIDDIAVGDELVGRR